MRTIKLIIHTVFAACMIPGLFLLFCAGYIYEHCRMAMGAGIEYAEKHLEGSVIRHRERKRKESK